MTDRTTGTPSVLEELLLRRAIEGLNPAEAAALEELLAQHPDVHEHRYDFAAAAVLLATLTATEPMPDSVQRKISASAARRRGSAG